METKFVLGAGITGLTYAYYHKDHRIISTDLGGKLHREYLACTVLLHATSETEKLLRDVGISIEPTAHIIRYFYKGRLQEEVPVAVHQILVAKKLTPWHALSVFDANVSSPEGSLSTPTSYIPIYRVKTSDLIKKLAEEVRWIEDRVLRITPECIVTESGAIYKYSELVSTIPAPEFWRLYEQPRKFGYFPITYVYSDTNPVPDHPDTAWDLIYFVDSNIKYTRVNRDPYTGRYLYEFTDRISEEEVRGFYPDLNIREYFVQTHGVIVTDFNNIPPPNVRFLGRYAQWDHRFRIQDAIREALIRYDFVSVWNHQKAFNANFFDYNVRDGELQQRLTKDFVLLLTDEAHQLLDQINWKMARYRDIEVDKERILEEWVDIFKYWLGIANIWGFTPEDFFNEFWRKSRLVESKYTHEVIERIRESLSEKE